MNGRRLSGTELREVVEALASDGSTTNGNGDTSVNLQLVQLKRDNEDLRHQLSTIKNNLQLSSLMPLLSTPTKVKLTANVVDAAGATILAKDTELEFQPADKFTSMLPLLLGGLGGGDSDGSSNNMLMAVAIATMGGD